VPINREHRHIPSFAEHGPNVVLHHDAQGDGITDDTAAFQAAIDTGEKTIFVPHSDNTYLVELFKLTYQAGTPVQWIFGGAARTTDWQGPNVYVFPNGTLATDDLYSLNITTQTAEQADAYRVSGRNDSTGNAELNAFHFELFAGPNTETVGTVGDAVRGVIGRVTNEGTSECKAIRVGASDTSELGANSLIAFNGDVRPNANTNSCFIMLMQEQGDAGVDDVCTALRFASSQNNRWKDGILFDQGMEYEGDVLQASMGTGSDTNARFLKLKDGSASPQFEVWKDGTVHTKASLHVGSSTTNGVQITSSTVDRTAPGGALTIRQGSTAGSVLNLGRGSQFQCKSTGVVMNSSLAYMGAGTLHAKGFWDDGTPVTDFVLEAYVTGEVDLDKYTSPQAKRFTMTELDIDAHADIWKERYSLPAMPDFEEYRDDAKHWSVGQLVTGLWEELEKAHVFIDQLNQRVKALEAE